MRKDNIRLIGKTLVGPGALACLGMLAGGCSDEPGFTNDLYDRSEPHIVNRDQTPGVAPLKPILEQLDPREEAPVGFGQPTEIRPEDLIPQIEDYRIGKNDLVQVSVNDLMGDNTGEVVRSERVSETGYITLQLLDPIKAEGYTEHELEKQIIQEYKKSNLIRSVRVHVTVIEARARTFSMMRNVGQPGEYQITRPDYRILDALIAARGPANPQGVDYLYVVRNAKAVPTAPPSAPPVVEPEKNPTVPDVTPPTNPNDFLVPHTQVAPTSPDATAARTIAPMMMDMATATTVPSVRPAASTRPSTMPASATLPSLPAGLPVTVTPPSGGFQFNAPEQSADTQRVIRVPLRELFELGELKYNIVVRPGDLIVVPDPVSGVFYMGGHINRPGVYTVSGATPETLVQAVIGAGGYDLNAVPERTMLTRRIGRNSQITIRVQLNKIANGELPDVFLKPNDTIWVGTDILASFITAVRTSFRFTYGFGFTYDRNFYTGNGT